MATVEPVPAGCRPMRADARRNREAVLRAARKVFARAGTEAQIDDVARKAGVGVGTVYRHFPTKDALIDALIADHVEQVCRFTAEALEADDAWEGLCESMRRGAELAARDRGLTSVFTDRADQVGAAHAARSDLRANTQELLRRAQADGKARADLAADDIGMVMCGISHAIHAMDRGDGWRRHLQLVLDGMSARAASAPLP